MDKYSNNIIDIHSRDSVTDLDGHWLFEKTFGIINKRTEYGMRQIESKQRKKVQSCTTHDSTVTQLSLGSLGSSVKSLLCLFSSFLLYSCDMTYNLQDFQFKLYSESCDYFY